MLRARRSSGFVGSDYYFPFFYTSLSLVFPSLDMYVDWVEFPSFMGGWEMDGLLVYLAELMSLVCVCFLVDV